MVGSVALESGYSRNSAVVAIFLVVSIGHWPVSEACGRQAVKLEYNGYRHILIAIGDNVPEDPDLLDRIQYVFTKASAFLYEITKKRAFFEKITVLVPKSWSNKTNYAPATEEAIDLSDINVDRLNPEQGHKPFVIHVRQCGERGWKMQLTPEYLKDAAIAEQYGTYEKVIVHEWAHLRYGVFNEYPEDFPKFYAAENGDIEGTRCSKALKGKRFDYVKDSDICDFENGLPTASCQFKDDQEVSGKYGSLMYSHKLDHVIWFCDNDTNSPNTLHNRQAPNAQNKKCDGKSVWEVLRSHKDFAEGANKPRDVPSTVPKFHFVKEYRRKRIVIVLDISGSMKDNNKIQKLAQSVAIYIQHVPVDGDLVGMVWFNSTATIMSNLIEVKSSTRDQLLKLIPKKADGGTSIGDGLLKGIEALSSRGDNPARGRILLVTDGEETESPYVASVTSQIISKAIIVDAIAVTEEADQQIEELVENTTGSIYYFSNRVFSNVLNEALITIGQQGTDVRNRQILLSSESVTIKGNHFYEDNVVIDSSIGRKTEFLIAHSSNNITIEMMTPSRRKISRNDAEYNTDNVFNFTRIQIPGVAEKGYWTLNITNPTSVDENVTITAVSGATDNDDPIVTTAAWIKRTLLFPDERQILYVSVSKGLSPVLHANVTAILERPDYSNVTAPPIHLPVRDNGAGADVEKDDGIYTTYVTYFTDNGRYNVKVKVTASPESVVVKNKIVGTGGSGAAGRKRDRRETGYIQRTEDFQRVTSAGSFKLQNFTEGVDAFPPAKVTDLRVSADDVTKAVTLSWTATGEDLDQGTVSSYVLWKSKDFETVYSNHWNATKVQVNITPEAAGKEENYTITVEETGNVTYYFALEAVDNSGNVSPRSNIVSVSLKYLNDGVTHSRIVPEPTLNLPLIVGCVVGSFVLITLIIAGIIIYIYGRKKGHWSVNSGVELQQNDKGQQMKY
ncbi:calcium-activated chloride channel regulator 1-like [Liolophura sinensis]|uniref:calcium-activated chloride channel regulator 1-like n=1 Tax=Liolophura sinensis TaxID=3198878 RepID=UPI003158ADD1